MDAANLKISITSDVNQAIGCERTKLVSKSESKSQLQQQQQQVFLVVKELS